MATENGVGPVHPSHPLLVRVRREDDAGPWLMQQVMKRTKTMADRFEGDGRLVDNCWRDFALQTPVMGIWALTLPQLRMHMSDLAMPSVVGHCLGRIVEHENRYVAWVYHAETDTEVPLSREIMDQFTVEAERWIAEYNALQATINPELCVYEIMMNSHRGRDTGVWERHGAFEQHRVIFRRMLHATKKDIQSFTMRERQTERASV